MFNESDQNVFHTLKKKHER